MALLFVFAYMTRAYVEAGARAEAMERLANTDFLTDAPNRRHLYETLLRENEEAARYGGPLSVILFDPDRFKLINDSLGHEAGDLVLEEVARLVGRRLRKADRFGRWGGEEFLVVAPGTDLGEALRSAERLRRAVEGHGFGVSVGVLTASFGVASRRAGDTPEALVGRADEALYRAKANGRNRAEG